MGSGRAIKKKFKVAVIHVTHKKQYHSNYPKGVRTEIPSFRKIYYELHFHTFCKVEIFVE